MLDKPIVVDEQASHDSIGYRIFNFDQAMAPAGKTVITSILTTPNYEYWEHLREHDPVGYKAQKDRLAGEVIDVLERKIGVPIFQPAEPGGASPVTILPPAFTIEQENPLFANTCQAACAT